MGFDFPTRCDMIERVDLDGFMECFRAQESIVWADGNGAPGLAIIRSDSAYHNWFARPEAEKSSHLKLRILSEDSCHTCARYFAFAWAAMTYLSRWVAIEAFLVHTVFALIVTQELLETSAMCILNAQLWLHCEPFGFQSINQSH